MPSYARRLLENIRIPKNPRNSKALFWMYVAVIRKWSLWGFVSYCKKVPNVLISPIYLCLGWVLFPTTNDCHSQSILMSTPQPALDWFSLYTYYTLHTCTFCMCSSSVSVRWCTGFTWGQGKLMSVCSVEHEIHVARHAYRQPHSPLVTVYLSLCIFIAILTEIPTYRCTQQYNTW